MINEYQSLKYLDNILKLSEEYQSLERKSAPFITRLDKLTLNLENNGLDPREDQNIISILQKLEEYSGRKKALLFRLNKNLSIVKEPIDARVQTEEFANVQKPIKTVIEDTIVELLKGSKIEKGTAAEIGGTRNSIFAKRLPSFDVSFLSLYEEKEDDRIIKADITDCAHVPSESFDVIVSINVFEHIDKPWQAAKEIIRLLKPGGITFHAVPFSYFYHEAPIDYWRYSPACLENLFDELESLLSTFYSKDRRRDNRGSEFNPVERFGGAQFAIDGFGGWRETWYTFYAGRKASVKAF